MVLLSKTNDPQSGDYTLDDLQNITGASQRSIRNYIQKGLLPRPTKGGRGARYTNEHRVRIEVVKRMKDVGDRQKHLDLTLDQMRQLMDSLTWGQLQEIAEGSLEIGAIIDTDQPASTESQLSRRIGHHELPLSRKSMQAAFSGLSLQARKATDRTIANKQSEGYEDFSRLDEIEHALQDLTHSVGRPRSSTDQVWHRIEITKDVELHVRGTYSHKDLSKLQKIGDLLRQLFMRGLRR